MTIEPSSNIKSLNLESEMRSSYLDYAMSVIVSRALPDVRDGLKPVQRRIVWGMFEGGARPGSGYRKSAGIVGDVMGRYHPHGDSSVYEAMVRLAQDFSLRYPLVDGQGNFGSVDGDPPAAMRYTEARLDAIAEELVADIDQNTVDFEPNYDGRYQAPEILPSRLPNLLLNGSSGIAVGMATSIPPHNLRELVQALKMLIENPKTSLDEILEVVKGPDFPTAAFALVGKDREQVKDAYRDGRGKVTLQARTTIEESSKGQVQLIISELPYQVNKSVLIEKIADLVRSKKIEGIADIRDESDRNGMRMVLDLKREGSIAQIRNLLYKHTRLRSTFPINMMVLVDGAPRRVGLKTALEHFLDHRRVVIKRRTQFQLDQAKDREHIVQGLLLAIDLLDQVIATIRGSDSANAALATLQEQPFEFSELQARAILDMQLRRLAALERQNLQEEHRELVENIAYLEGLLEDRKKIDFLIRDDLDELDEDYGDDRRTEILEAAAETFSEEDLVPHEDSVITLSRRNYIKRTPLSEYRVQRRGGKGARGATVRDEDAVLLLNVCDSHDNILFLTDQGKVYHLRAFDVPDSRKQSRGSFITNLIEMTAGERVTTILNCASYDDDFMVLFTRNGQIKKTPLREYAEVRRNGKIAMRLDKGDELVSARFATGDGDVLIVTTNGYAVRCSIDNLRSASRTSGGVRGITLASDAAVVTGEAVSDNQEILIITQRGLGKRTIASEYPRHRRGGKGVRTLHITDRTGIVAACRVVKPDEELIVATDEGMVIRVMVEEIRQTGRNTQGVIVMKDVGENDQVSSIATFRETPEDQRVDSATNVPE